ncbi:MAG: hypothetical protein AAGG01_09015 [Planctomycetota bacterium]
MPYSDLALTSVFLLLVTVSSQAQEATGLNPAHGPKAPLGYSTSVAQLTGGDLLVGLPAGDLLVLDAETGETLAQRAEPVVAAMCFWLSPDQRHIAIRQSTGLPRIRPFDEASLLSGAGPLDAADEGWGPVGIGERSPSGAIGRSAWAPGGKHLITWLQNWHHGPSKGSVRIWGLDGAQVWEGPFACDVTVHPTLDQIAFVEPDRVTIGWPGTGFRKVDLPGACCTIDYSPDGKQLALGGTCSQIRVEGEAPRLNQKWDGRATVTIVDTASAAILRRVQPETGVFPRMWLQRVSWSPKGDYLGFSAGKGYVGGVLRVGDMKTLWNQFSGAQMWAILGGFWVSEDRYRPCFPLDYHEGDASFVFDVKDAGARIMTPQRRWLGVTPLRDASDVIARHIAGIARVNPKTMEVVWAR